MKRLMISFIAVLCCMVMNAQTTFEVDGINYSTTGENTVEVAKYKSTTYSGVVIIPATVTSESGTEYYVTGIGKDAFLYCYDLTSITIPSSVTSIGDWAFNRCTSLTSITIPEGVKSIGQEAFYYCSGLTSMCIPNSVTSIGRGAFRACSGLTSVTISSSVTNIKYDTFSGCIGLTSITIPERVDSIEMDAFFNCTNLEYLVVIPENPPTVNQKAFTNVETNSIPVYVPNDNYTNWGEFTNFKGVEDYKAIALNEIDAAMTGLELTDAEKGVISNYKTQINSASNLATAVAAKEVAMAIINLPKARYDALAAIDGKMDEVTTLTDAEKQSINSYKAAINEATTEGVINQNKATAIAYINLHSKRNNALAEIDGKMDEVTTLTDAEKQSINSYKVAINEATTEVVINQNKETAIVYINLHSTRNAALADIQEEIKETIGSSYLNELVAEDVNAINAATDENAIITNKESAVNKVQFAIQAYKSITSETLGTLATPQAGCVAVKVTKGDKEVILYAPDKVKVIKIPANK